MVDKALARKYRPGSFEEMVGQDAVVKTLKNALKTGRIHPSYIFSGIRGVGKTTAARLLARGLNCSDGITSIPCGKCPSCLEIARSSSMDVLEIDGATHTGVDQVRDLTQAARYRPVRDRYRVFIIDEVHMLSKAAFNALLKTLEEPPDHVVFILATTEPVKVPETIRSRSQHFEFKRVPVSRVTDFLASICERENVKAEPGALELIARSGEGSIRDCLTLVDRLRTYSDGNLREEDAVEALGLIGRRGLEQLVTMLAAGEARKVSLFVDDMRENGRDGERFLKDLVSLVRELLRIKVAGESEGQVRTEQTAEGSRLASLFTEEDILRLYDLLLQTQDRVKGAPDPEAVLELQLLKAAMLPGILPLDQIIEGLSAGVSNPLHHKSERPEDSTPPKEIENTQSQPSEKKESNIAFKGIMAFQQMDEGEAETYSRNTQLDRFRDLVAHRFPLVASGLKGANLSLDPDGVLHIQLENGARSAAALLGRPETRKKLQEISTELGFSEQIQISTAERETTEKKPGKEDKSIDSINSATRKVLEVLGGKVIKSDS